MNNKVLASLAVVVALLAGWLVTSVMRQPNVSIKSDKTKTEATVQGKNTSASDSVKAGESGVVETQVTIPTNIVKTQVKIKK